MILEIPPPGSRLLGTSGEGTSVHRGWMREVWSSAVYLAPVSSPDDVNCSGVVIDSVNHPIVTDADSPEFTFSLQLLDTTRSGIAGKSLESLINPLSNRVWEILDLASGP